MHIKALCLMVEDMIYDRLVDRYREVNCPDPHAVAQKELEARMERLALMLTDMVMD